MKPNQITTSAVLFYDSEQHQAIPLEWFERALQLFNEFALSPILFTAAGGRFEFDDCYLLRDGGEPLFRWHDPVPIFPCHAELVRALQDGIIYSLHLDVPRPDSNDRSDWRASASLCSIRSDLYLGIDEELLPETAAAMRRACQMGKGLVDFKYGFAYKMPLANEPDSYAEGSGPFSFADFREWMRRKSERIEPQLTPDDLWQKELSEGRRHLDGYFRGAYPANLLSAAHVGAADLVRSPIGKLCQLDDALWLWELSGIEIPLAEAMLRAKNLLVAQLSPT